MNFESCGRSNSLQSGVAARDPATGSVPEGRLHSSTAGLANTCTHLFDLLRFYLGDVAWVQAVDSSNPLQSLSDPNVDGWLGFEGGFLATLQACDVRS